MPSRSRRTLCTSVLLAAALLAPGPARACGIPLRAPANNLTAIQSPEFRWSGDCLNYRVQFSTSGNFATVDLSTPWSPRRHYQMEEDSWDEWQGGAWSGGVYWRVQGGDAAGGRFDSPTVRRVQMDPDLDDDGVSLGGGDCDDADPTVSPGAPEACNALDDDCNGAVDDGIPFAEYTADADGDGYGVEGEAVVACAPPAGMAAEPGDCDDGDPARHPGAQEVCADEIDNDCDAGVDTVDLDCPLGHGLTGVVLIVVDTLRGDRVGCDAAVGLMPHAEGLAAEGSCFSDARAAAPWTLPATTSLMTGLHMPSHGVWTSEDPDLSAEVPTAPDLLRPYGFRSAMFTANPLAASHGIAGRYEGGIIVAEDQFACDADRDLYLLERTSPTLDQLEVGPSSRFYLHYQFMSPHAPYCPQGVAETTFGGIDVCTAGTQAVHEEAEAGNLEMIAGAESLYDLEATWVDGAIQQLLEVLDERGILESTLVVLTADHGEAFMTHNNWGHGSGLTRDQVHVPLVFWGPGVPAGSVIPSTVSATDVLPTLLDLMGIPVAEHLEGRPLVDLMNEPATAPPYRAWSTLLLETGTLFDAIASTGTDGTMWTLIQRHTDGTSNTLYHDGVDLDQQTDLVETGQGRNQLRFLSQMLDAGHYDWSDWVGAYWTE